MLVKSKQHMSISKRPGFLIRLRIGEMAHLITPHEFHNMLKNVMWPRVAPGRELQYSDIHIEHTCPIRKHFEVIKNKSPIYVGDFAEYPKTRGLPVIYSMGGKQLFTSPFVANVESEMLEPLRITCTMINEKADNILDAMEVGGLFDKGSPILTIKQPFKSAKAPCRSLSSKEIEIFKGLITGHCTVSLEVLGSMEAGPPILDVDHSSLFTSL